MLKAIPLTIIPLVAYNLVGYGLAGADPWGVELVMVPMPSGAWWPLRLGDMLIVLAMVTLYVEVIRAARATSGVFNRTLSVVVLITYAVEFAAADAAAHSVFFILTAIALFDVAAGTTIRKARHEALATLESRLRPSADEPQ